MIKELLVNDIVTLTAAALGLVVNCATLIALLLNRRHLSTKAYLVLSLTLCGIVTVAGSVLHTLYNEHAIAGIDCLSQAQVLMRDVKYVGIILTLLGLNALCIDLYVAVMYSMRYRVVCCKRRVRLLICMKWLVGVLLGSASSISHLVSGGQKKARCNTASLIMTMNISEVFSLRKEYDKTNKDAKMKRMESIMLAQQVPTLLPAPPRPPPPPLMNPTYLMHRFYISDCILVAVLAASVLFITLSLMKIYRKLRRRVRRNGNLSCGGELSSACGGASGGIRRHCSISGSRAKRRGASTILVLFVGFNATVLPYMIGEFYSIVVTNRAQSKSSSSTQADLQFILYSMPYLAALAVSFTVLNPVVLSLRMREVQAGYVIMCRRLRNQHSQQRNHDYYNHRHNMQMSMTDTAVDNNDSIMVDRLAERNGHQNQCHHRTCREHCGSRSSNNSYGMVSFSMIGNDRASCSQNDDEHDTAA